MITDAQTLLLIIITGFIVSTIWMIIYWFDRKTNSTKEPISENINAKNNLYELYLKVDPKRCRDLIDELVDHYIKEYSLYHFTVQEVEYIKSNEIEEMIKMITETMYINLSDFYAFQIRMLINVKDEEDILGYIRDTVKTRVILYVAEKNKTT